MVEPRQRFQVLDGLRGVAALAVVLFHLGRWTNRDLLFEHGYLAVDFFFCLSGFVMAHAYEDRLAKRLTLREFARLRLVRLWPMIALSMCLGAAYGVAKVVMNSPGADTIAGVTMCLVLGLLLIPRIWQAHESYLDRVFPLNVAAWSLFFELVANLLWAATARWLSSRILFGVAGVTGAAMLAVGWSHGDFEVGANLQTFWLGFPRVFFSFTLGLLVYRVHASGRSVLRAPAWLLSPLLLAVLAIPEFKGQAAAELLAISLVFPLIVLIGAGEPDRAGAPGALWRFSGEVSYPLYALHAPLWFLVSRGLEIGDIEISLSVLPIFAAGVVVGSWAALKLFDEPARRWLGKLSRRAAARVTAAI